MNSKLLIAFALLALAYVRVSEALVIGDMPAPADNSTATDDDSDDDWSYTDDDDDDIDRDDDGEQRFKSVHQQEKGLLVTRRNPLIRTVADKRSVGLLASVTQTKRK